MDNVQSIMSYGNRNNSLGDKFCAFVLALTPLLQHYRGLVENAGFTALLLITPVLFVRTIKKLNSGFVERKTFLAIIPLIIFFFYTIIIRDFNVMRLGYVLLLSWIFLCISNGSINISYFFKWAKRIAALASIAIIIQFVLHNIFGRTIDFRPLSLLVSQENIWVRTSVYFGAGNMFRPSGFFLEPSHFFLYSFPIITVSLLSLNKNKKDFRTAVFLSLGLLLTTSGMGLVVLAGLWTLYFLIYKKVSDYSFSSFAKQISVRSVLIFLLLLALLYVAYRGVPFIRNAVDRILTEDQTSNAIDGRTRLVQNYVRGINGQSVWFGTPNVIMGELGFNIPGFFATYIKFGVFGLLFSYWFYLQGLFKLKGPFFWLTLIIVVISYFTAHTHGTFYMLYFVMFLMNGYYESNLKVPGKFALNPVNVT